uniref:Alpha-carbonic anhydrase domain-containing protein n=1 Tax=Macrostomum lignano TaxID=282301 RepID=A0A1I8FN09_9PLAT
MYYTASQLHWHWGADNSRGSEHTMEGRAYPWRAIWCFTTATIMPISALQCTELAASLCWVFSTNCPTLITPCCCGWSPTCLSWSIFKTSVDVKFNSSDFNFVDAFLPKYRRYFYRYEGGLTTPTCNENVLWTVFRSASQVSARQLKLLRSLRYPSGKAMVDNYRPPQPLNSPHRPGANRLVYRTFDRRGRASGDSGFLVDVPGDTCGALGSAGGASAVALAAAAVLSGWRAIY